MEDRIEQVYINKPAVTVYFKTGEDSETDSYRCYLGAEELSFVSAAGLSEANETEGHFILIDISASIPAGRFRQTKEKLLQYIDSLEDSDYLEIITFGEHVRVEFKGPVQDFYQSEEYPHISSLTNKDQRTKLFEAIYQAANDAQMMTEQGCVRKTALVITDGEDIAEGTKSRNEALSRIKSAGIPVYGMSYADTDRNILNAFGEFCRESGGELELLQNGKEEDAFSSLANLEQNMMKLQFVCADNVVSKEPVTLLLERSSTGAGFRTQVLEKNWIPDEEAPQILTCRQENATQIRVDFSEPMRGLETAGNYILEGDNAYIPVAASPGDGYHQSVILTFPEGIKGGDYSLICENITDYSMENNALQGETQIHIVNDIPEKEAYIPGIVQITNQENITYSGGEVSSNAEENGDEEPAEEDGIAQESEIPEETGVFQETLFRIKDYAAVHPWITGCSGLLLLGILAGLAGLILRRKKKEDAVQQTVPGPVVKHQIHTVAGPRHIVYLAVPGNKNEIRYDMTDDTMVIGRSSYCDIAFNDPTMSRKHMVIEINGDTALLSNLSAGQATWVNGIRVRNKEAVLHRGDEITAGKTRMIIRW